MPSLADDLENVRRPLVIFYAVLAHSHSETPWTELETIASAIHGAVSLGGIHMMMAPMTQETAEKGICILVVMVLKEYCVTCLLGT